MNNPLKRIGMGRLEVLEVLNGIDVQSDVRIGRVVARTIKVCLVVLITAWAATVCWQSYVNQRYPDVVCENRQVLLYTQNGPACIDLNALLPGPTTAE